MDEPISTCGEQSRTTFDPLEALTIREVAALLHCSEPTVRKHIKLGELPSIQIGRCRRIRRVDLGAFLESRIAYGWQRHEPRQPRPPDEPVEWSGDDTEILF